MNVRFVVNQLGLLLLVMSGVLLGLELLFLGAAAWQGLQTDFNAQISLAATAALGVVLGGVVYFGTRRELPGRSLGRRDALLLVGLSWLLGAAFAALPYFIWATTADTAGPDHPFQNFVNCYFEAMSGLTTTGATILTDIEALPKSLLIWRAFTHWIGGLGIVVLFVAVLPSLGVGGKRLYRVEAPGPSKEAVTPNIRETARALWLIYLSLTAIQVLALILTGMDWFDAVCHTFATLATGGFSTKNASIGAYSTASMIVTIVFMVIAGMNFSLFFEIARGRFRAALRDTEWRVYLIMLAAASVIVIISLLRMDGPLLSTTGAPIEKTAGNAILEGTFTTVSIQTTTGFCTSDFNLWPFSAQAVLVFLMFVGGCAGSTAGGIKVVRLWVTLKIMLAELERVFRPNVVRPVRLGQGTLDAELKKTTLAYVLGIVVMFAIGAVLVMLLETWLNPLHHVTFETAATASLACICTIGPGLEKVGATANYGWMTDPSKVVLSLLMVIGRLEVFAILVLFTPRFWRGN